MREDGTIYCLSARYPIDYPINRDKRGISYVVFPIIYIRAPVFTLAGIIPFSAKASTRSKSMKSHPYPANKLTATGDCFTVPVTGDKNGMLPNGITTSGTPPNCEIPYLFHPKNAFAPVGADFM
jgi:hypothetical protein